MRLLRLTFLASGCSLVVGAGADASQLVIAGGTLAVAAAAGLALGTRPRSSDEREWRALERQLRRAQREPDERVVELRHEVFDAYR